MEGATVKDGFLTWTTVCWIESFFKEGLGTCLLRLKDSTFNFGRIKIVMCPLDRVLKSAEKLI